MKTQTILLAVLLFIGLSNVTAENKETTKAASATLSTTLSGTITDASTSESLVGVKVVIEELNAVAYTDFDGKFEFKVTPDEVYTLKTDYVSYKTNDAVLVNTKEIKNLNIALKADL